MDYRVKTSVILCVILVMLTWMANTTPVAELRSSNRLVNNSDSVEELTFIEDDPDCNGICLDDEPKPLCVVLNSDRRIKKTVFNECILKRVNCHYKNSYSKILDRACPTTT